MEPNLTLKGLIYGKYGKEVALAQKLGWPKQRLNRITTGRSMPNIEEVNALASALDTPVDQMISIFLAYKSPNRQQ